jgi:ABC-type sugar transport system permease subunit
MIFKWIFNAEWGVLNTVLRVAGLGALATNWLGTPGVVLGAVIIAHYWATFGFSFVLILTGLSTVEKDLLESAALDGAGKIRMSRGILLPLIVPTFVTALMLSFLGKMRAFHVVWVLTQGGPMHYSETVATYVQKRAFQWMTLDLGYPSAIALVWFGVVMVVLALANRWIGRRMPRYM